MSLQRRLPKTDAARLIALNAAKTKKDNTAPGLVVITPNTITRLDTTQPLFASLMQTRANDLQAQTDSTASKETKQAKARMFVSHFFQSFINGVARGVFPNSHKAFYQLEVSSDKVPPLDSEPLLTFWGQRLIDGDAARIIAGGAPMSMPTIAEVVTEYNNYKTENIAQSTLKDAYDNAQEDVGAERPEADAVILRIWNEVETAHDDETPESKRRKCREYGVVYVSTEKATITGNVTDAGSGNPLPDVNVSLLEAGDSVVTIANGTYKLVTNFTGEGTLEFSLAGFVTQTFPVDVPEGGAVVQDAGLVLA